MARSQRGRSRCARIRADHWTRHPCVDQLPGRLAGHRVRRHRRDCRSGWTPARWCSADGSMRAIGATLAGLAAQFLPTGTATATLAAVVPSARAGAAARSAKWSRHFRHRYYRRRLAAGKTPMEALRALKRRLSDIVYRQMVADAKLVRTGPGGHAGATLQSSAADLNPEIDTSKSHFPDPPHPSLEQPSPPPLDTEGCQIRARDLGQRPTRVSTKTRRTRPDTGGGSPFGQRLAAFRSPPKVGGGG